MRQTGTKPAQRLRGVRLAAFYALETGARGVRYFVSGSLSERGRNLP